MIVVDTSALIAVLLDEAEARPFARTILRDGDPQVAAPTALEYLMVAQGRHGRSEADSRLLLTRLNLSIVAWQASYVILAQDAFVRFGKGRGHPAQLNFGDCISYALATALNAPLLYKGDDFTRTDIRPAL